MSCEGGCGFHGNKETANRCSRCYREYLAAQGKTIAPLNAGKGQQSTVRCQTSIMGCSLQVRFGDLTQEQVDAVVNAANTNLDHSGGLARALVDAAGWGVQEKCDVWVRKNGPLPYGHVLETDGGKMHCKWLLHAVGPQWKQGMGHSELGGPEVVLQMSMRNILEKAAQLEAKTVSIPAISSGIFGFPRELCAKILFDVCLAFLEEQEQAVKRGGVMKVQEIRFTNFDEPTVGVFEREFQSRFKTTGAAPAAEHKEQPQKSKLDSTLTEQTQRQILQPSQQQEQQQHVQLSEQRKTQEQQQQHQQHQQQPASNQQWACSICTFANIPERTICEVCSTKRSS